MKMSLRRTLLLLSGFFIYSEAQLAVDVTMEFGEFDINGRDGCNYMRTCCSSVNLEGWRFGNGGSRVSNTTNVYVNRFIDGNGLNCSTIFFEPARSGVTPLACLGFTDLELIARTLNVVIPANSSALQISVSGSPQKNITGKNVGETVSVGCQVESCLTEAYTVQFRRPDTTVFNTQFSSVMMMGFSASLKVAANMSGQFSCEVLDSERMVQSSASFEFVGTPGQAPPTEPPTIDPPVYTTCPSTQGRDIALGVVFSLLGLAAAVTVVVVLLLILYKFTNIFDSFKSKKNGEPLRNESDTD